MVLLPRKRPTFPNSIEFQQTPSLRNPTGHLHVDLDELIPRWAEKFERIPNSDKFKSKSEWRAMKREVRRVSEAGFIPPYGSRWKNAIYGLRDKLRWR